jgi:hypothetical protein
VSCSKEGSEFDSPLRSTREVDEQKGGTAAPSHLAIRAFRQTQHVREDAVRAGYAFE